MIAEHLSRVRFMPEQTLLDSLFEQFGLEEIIQHLTVEQSASPIHQIVVGTHVRLTPLLAPRIFRIYEQVAACLGFDESVELFVHPEHEVNAFALQRLGEDSPHLISLTSEMVRSMTDEELRFAVGHELGHLALRHHRLHLVSLMLSQQKEREEDKSEQPAPLLQRRLEKWQRLAEFSADRIGFHACGGDLPVAVAAFYKMASGLGPQDLNFDIDAFCDQLDRLQSLDRREVLALFSHPATPVRARALQLYAEAGGVESSEQRLREIDAQVEKLAELMDFEVTTDFGTHAREFFIAAGLLAAHADGQVDEREHEVLVRLLLQFTGDPERHLASVRSVEEAEQRLADACAWLSENAGQDKYVLFGQLMHVICISGVVDPAERAFMDRVAGLLAIPDKAARELMHEVHSRHAQTKPARRAGFLGFGS
jgi:uncharacterized tellurite resistance protein B-like protein